MTRMQLLEDVAANRSPDVNADYHDGFPPPSLPSPGTPNRLGEREKTILPTAGNVLQYPSEPVPHATGKGFTPPDASRNERNPSLTQEQHEWLIAHRGGTE